MRDSSLPSARSVCTISPCLPDKTTTGPSRPGRASLMEINPSPRLASAAWLILPCSPDNSGADSGLPRRGCQNRVVTVVLG